MSQQFAQRVGRFRDMALLKQKQVYAAALAEMADAIQLPVSQGGRMPVDTERLRNSLRIYIAGFGVFNSVAEFRAATAQTGVPLNRTVRFFWPVPYARRINNGFVGRDSLGRYYNQSGYFFVEFGAGKWLSIVRRLAAEARGR